MGFLAVTALPPEIVRRFKCDAERSHSSFPSIVVLESVPNVAHMKAGYCRFPLKMGRH